jgi:hypothetical protein
VTDQSTGQVTVRHATPDDVAAGTLTIHDVVLPLPGMARAAALVRLGPGHTLRNGDTMTPSDRGPASCPGHAVQYPAHAVADVYRDMLGADLGAGRDSDADVMAVVAARFRVPQLGMSLGGAYRCAAVLVRCRGSHPQGLRTGRPCSHALIQQQKTGTICCRRMCFRVIKCCLQRLVNGTKFEAKLVNVHNRKLVARADDLAVEMLSSAESSVGSPDGASMNTIGTASLSDNYSGAAAAFTFTLPPSSYATVCLQEIMQSRG